jgi:hypothetical protein
MKLIESESSVLKAGDEYGRYTVLGIFKKADGYQKYARVQCACGSNPRYVQVGTLRNGESQSCGCLHKERVSTHGLWGTPLFHAWRGMVDRCMNPKNKRFDRYGGRGITVCAKWMDAQQFISDMGPKFRRGMSLDRIDNDGPYSPENCRWATSKQQTRNYSRNVLVSYRGETKCLKEWAEILGINYGTLWDRIKVQKLPPAIAFTR